MESENSFIKNFAWKFLERISAQIVSLVVSVILARLLLPEDYGVISMVTIFITFADILVVSGLPSALIQRKDADDVDFSSVFYCNLIISIVLYVILLLVSPYIALFFEMPILSAVLKILGIRVVVSSISSVQHAYVSRHMMFKKYFWATLIGTIVSGVTGVALAYVGMGVWALVVQQLVSAVISAIVGFVVIRWIPKLLFSWKKLISLFAYGWKILFESVFETFTQQVRNLIIGKVYTSNDLGYYTKAQQFPNLVVNNVISSVAAVLFPVMSNVQEDKERVKELMRKSARLSYFILFPLMFGLALVAEPFVLVLLTEKWIECVPYLQIFCFTQGATIGMTVRHEALKSIGRSDVYMYEHMIYRIVVFAILIAVYKISVMAIALSLIAGSIIMSVTVGITSRKYNDYKFIEQLKDVLPTFFACIIMAVPVYLVGLINLPAIVTLGLQVVVGAMTYLVISIILKLEGYVYIRDLIKRFLHSRKGTENV